MTLQGYGSKKKLEAEIDYNNDKKIKWYDQLLLNRPLKVIIALILTSILAPILIYQFIFFNSLDVPPPDGYSVGSCLVPRESRIPCGVGDVSADQCHHQCCYDFSNNMCFHRLPSRFSYIVNPEPWSEESVLNPRIGTVPFGFQNSLSNIRLSVDEVSATHMSLMFYNPRKISLNGQRIDNKYYSYNITSPELNVDVSGPQGLLFSTIRGPLIASNNIWEIALQLTDELMFGLGELPLVKDTVKVIYSNPNGLSSIPLIFAKSNGSYHGLLIDVSSPTEILIQQENQIIVRSITNIGLKFHVFVGPKPKDIMKDVKDLIGFHKHLDYWMLGAHICSQSDVSMDTFIDLNNFLMDATTERLPYESHCGVAPITFNEKCDFEEIDYVQRGATLLRNSKKRFVPHISPYVRYEIVESISAEEISSDENDEEVEQEPDVVRDDFCSYNIESFQDFMILDAQSSNFYVGFVNNRSVVYPIYENITVELMEKLWVYDVDLDGVLLENSWPLDESDQDFNDTYLLLPYFSQNFETAFRKTLKWNVAFSNSENYFSVHNKYGNNFANALELITGDNTPILTASQWMNGEVAINRQKIDASWTNLKRELVEAALGGISGHWLWASPICGDTEDFDPETQTQLCVKWYMAATYMPMININSKSVPRHPLSFVGTNKIHIVDALNQRLSLLPYFFTTLQQGPLLRPMFYQFPESKVLEHLNTQFSVGDDLLIVPNLQPMQTHVHVWMPPGTWYEVWSGLRLVGEEGDPVTMTTTEADFLTLIRGGSILVIQREVSETAEETRLLSNYHLKIALHCTNINITKDDIGNPLIQCQAIGHLYMTPNMTLTFEADSERLEIRTVGEDFDSFCDISSAVWARNLRDVHVYGLNDEFNNNDHHREIVNSIDLCRLRTEEKIVLPFF